MKMATSAWGKEESFWSVLEKNCVELQKKHNMLHKFLQPEKRTLLLLEMVLHWIREPDILCVTKRRTANVDLFVLDVASMYVLNTRTLSASTVLSLILLLLQQQLVQQYFRFLLVLKVSSLLEWSISLFIMCQVSKSLKKYKENNSKIRILTGVNLTPLVQNAHFFAGRQRASVVELSWFYLAIINIQLEKTQISARTPGHWSNRKVVESMPLSS